MKRWFLVVVVAVAAWHWWSQRDVPRAPGVVAAAAPLQSALTSPVPTLSKPGYQIKPLAVFALEARVLGIERYRFDRGADLSPVDLALGWGRMSDNAILERINITQSGRFYYWTAPEYPIPRREIETSSANVHIVPANETVLQHLSAIRRGHVVRLTGYLIEVQGSDGWRWKSSLTRADTGRGACELIWVERVDVR